MRLPIKYPALKTYDRNPNGNISAANDRNMMNTRTSCQMATAPQTKAKVRNLLFKSNFLCCAENDITISRIVTFNGLMFICHNSR